MIIEAAEVTGRGYMQNLPIEAPAGWRGMLRITHVHQMPLSPRRAPSGRICMRMRPVWRRPPRRVSRRRISDGRGGQLELTCMVRSSSVIRMTVTSCACVTCVDGDGAREPRGVTCYTGRPWAAGARDAATTLRRRAAQLHDHPAPAGCATPRPPRASSSGAETAERVLETGVTAVLAYNDLVAVEFSAVWPNSGSLFPSR